MNGWFAALPIHRKLTTLALGVAAAALVAAVLGLAIYDVVRFRATAFDDAHALAQVMAENLAAAIVFDDADAAKATLGTVRVRPNVQLACAYGADGRVVGFFARDASRQCPSQPRDARGWITVVSSAEVRQNGRMLGTVYVERDLSDLRGRIAATAGAGLIVLVLSGAIALGLARSLQTVVSRPIVALADAVRRVGRDHPYELPPIETAPDEVGELVRAFGDMVHRVGESNAALMETNSTLRREIDQRRRMQAEREALLAREREASRLKDEFLATVSHELRTPLNAILGWTQILESTNPSEETIARAVSSLSRNAHAQQRVIEDLLDISRIITGKLRLTSGLVDLRSAVDSAVDAVESMAQSRHITLQTHQPSIPCMVHGDLDRLRQVLWNLLTNALKFTPQGGRVDVRVREDGASYSVAVTDTGAGIKETFLPHVFERFRQADGSTTRQQGGLGLGLAIVKELVELHGGSVQAQSAGPETGSTFTIRIPRATQPSDAAGGETQAEGVRLDGVSVLVVDDNPDAVDIAVVALRRAGAAVQAASSGTAAVAAWERDPADVLLCDIAMPDMDGFDVLRRIRAVDAAAGRTTRALAVTAYASDEYRARCVAAGFMGHLAKPYNLEDAIRAVASVAAQR